MIKLPKATSLADERYMREAEKWIQKAIETNQRNGVTIIVGKDYALYGELFKRKEDRPKAQENFGEAMEIYRECGADGWVAKYEKELASLSYARLWKLNPST